MEECKVFQPADILIPEVEDISKWSVIACDQYTSEPEYWNDLSEKIGNAPSALHLILPEVRLNGENKEEISNIHKNMETYVESGIFTEYRDAFVYVERQMLDGTVRSGLVGKIDLEEYDYSADSVSQIRATERTVVERIPPRKAVRQEAMLELPHVLLLCDDKDNYLLSDIEEKKSRLTKLYDFDLISGGGHITGWLVDGELAKEFSERLNQYENSLSERYNDLSGTPMLFAVGDGNHSLATAKACWEDYKNSHPDALLSNHPSRYALVEIENIHDESQKFEPIHRLLTDVDVKALLMSLKEKVGCDSGYPVKWKSGNESGTVYLDPEKGELPVAILQAFLDEYLASHSGKIDYIHGADTLAKLCDKDDSIGFELPNIDKNKFFKGIIADGVLPRKTFSMGHASEKRYYLEARKIK